MQLGLVAGAPDMTSFISFPSSPSLSVAPVASSTSLAVVPPDVGPSEGPEALEGPEREPSTLALKPTCGEDPAEGPDAPEEDPEEEPSPLALKPPCDEGPAAQGAAV